MDYQTATYEHVLADLDDATRWLRSLGVRVPGGSRLEYYRSKLRFITSAWSSGDTDAVARTMKLGDFANVFFEATQWREIYRSLGRLQSEVLTDKLRAFVKGPKDYTAEKVSASSNTARNISFELSIAARLIERGFEVDFRPRPDLVTFHRGNAVFMQPAAVDVWPSQGVPGGKSSARGEVWIRRSRE